MSRKILFFILLVFIFLSGVSSAHAQQSIALKIGFNFISFTVAPSETPLQLKTRVAEIEDIYLFSAAAGSFLSVNEGSLSSLGAGKGYIIKSTAAASITVAGTSVTAVSDISLKTGFNLIGISQSVLATTFSGLMKNFGIIKGLYKWSAAAGSFIQVVAGTDGTPQQLDGADPQFKTGESYFVNVYDNTTLSFTDGALNFTGGTVPVTAPTAGGYVMMGMKTDGDDGNLSTPEKKMFFVLANTDTKKIPSGNHTVTAPNGEVYNFSANSYNGCAVTNYSYGNPQVSVGSIIDPRTNPASAQHPYMTVASVAAGSETGIFKFNVNGTEVSVTNSFGYLPAMKLTSHTQNSNFSVSSPVTVTWDSLGEDYVYCFTASKIPADSDWSKVSIIWSSVDVRDSKFYDPVAMQKFYDGCQTTNTATIPAGIFSAGDNVDFWVQAFKKSAFAHSEAAAYGQMQMHTSSVGVQVYGR